MSAFFGPESPRPLSVVSEKYQREIAVVEDLATSVSTNQSSASSPFSLGVDYERVLCQMVSRYAEINVDDKVCYVGPIKGSLARVFESRLKLIHGICELQPGRIVYEETSTGRLIPVAVAEPEAEEHFQKLANSDDDSAKYDKVILRDSLECLQERKTFIMNVMRSLRPEGRLLMIQRPAEMVTLPYFSEAKKRIQDCDVPVMDTINEIQALGFDVEWDIELLPVVIERLKWLSLLYNQYPNQLEITTTSEIFSGLRELSEGSLKYLWDTLEFNDRLLFVSVSQPLHKEALPECRRFGGSVLTTQPAPLIFEMPLADEMQKFVKMAEQIQQRRNPDRPEFFGTFNIKQWVNIDSSAIPSQLIRKQ